MPLIANICCIIYYVIATFQSLPTITRIIRRKSSTDISTVSTVLEPTATFSWSLYIFLTQQTTIVYIGTVWDLTVGIVYTIVVFVYHGVKQKSPPKDCFWVSAMKIGTRYRTLSKVSIYNNTDKRVNIQYTRLTGEIRYIKMEPDDLCDIDWSAVLDISLIT